MKVDKNSREKDLINTETYLLGKCNPWQKRCCQIEHMGKESPKRTKESLLLLNIRKLLKVVCKK